MHVPQRACGGQRVTCRHGFSFVFLSSRYVENPHQGIELGVSGTAMCTFTTLSHLVTSQVVLNLNSSPPLFSSFTSGSMIYTGRVGQGAG